MTKFLIIFPTKEDNIENKITNKQTGSAFVKEMLLILDRIDCEKEVEIYVDSDNKKSFIEDYRTLEELSSQRIGLYNLEEVLDSFISDNAIKIIRNKSFVPDFKIVIMNGFLAIDAFFSRKNTDRILNRNDFRHCENHPDFLHHKSPLIGGTNGFDNANRWLPSAIGDAKANRGILLNIDESNQNFVIRFEDENFNNQYHAFHLVKRVENRYVEDKEKLQQLRSSKKHFRRPLKLIEYRLTRTS